MRLDALQDGKRANPVRGRCVVPNRFSCRGGSGCLSKLLLPLLRAQAQAKNQRQLSAGALPHTPLRPAESTRNPVQPACLVPLPFPPYEGRLPAYRYSLLRPSFPIFSRLAVPSRFLIFSSLLHPPARCPSSIPTFTTAQLRPKRLGQLAAERARENIRASPSSSSPARTGRAPATGGLPFLFADFLVRACALPSSWPGSARFTQRNAGEASATIYSSVC